MGHDSAKDSSFEIIFYQGFVIIFQRKGRGSEEKRGEKEGGEVPSSFQLEPTTINLNVIVTAE